jgi:ubiquinone/menaquinone biosynthesis C-methylase UbiE
MQLSSERFNCIASNYLTSEIHRSSPTIARLHELLAACAVNTVCDVACGAGHLGLSFAGRASRIVAVDPAPNMLAAALLAASEKQVALETHNAAAEALPLPDGEFDLTASRLAPHHFTDVNAGLREMARVTKIGGRVAVIDMEGHPNAVYDDFNHRLELLHDSTHVRSYTAARWRDIFEQAGLVIEALESGLTERPAGVPVKRWCEIASSGEQAEAEINRLLREADPDMLSGLGIGEQETGFLMPVRTVLVLARRVGSG